MSSKNFIFFVCMYNMSSETKRLTKERKITAEIHSKNKTHTICVYNEISDEDYVI